MDTRSIGEVGAKRKQCTRDEQTEVGFHSKVGTFCTCRISNMKGRSNITIDVLLSVLSLSIYLRIHT